MPAYELLDCADDPRLHPYLHLKDPDLRREREVADGLFVVEGRLALETVLASAVTVRSVLVLRRKLAVLGRLAGGRLPAGVPVYAVDDEVMSQVAGFAVHRGLLAVAARPAPRAADEVLVGAAGRIVVVVEGMNDQENLGALFRNAAAFGAGGALLDPTCADPLYRRTVRVSLGHAARLPFCRLSPWPQALSLLGQHGYSPVALTPAGHAEDVRQVARELAGTPVALLVGAEGPGLSAGVLAKVRNARIPMAPGVGSLNVATAAAVALHCFSQPW